MRIVGPRVKLKHVKRITGEKTSAGTPITWATPIRFEGVMVMLTGKEVYTYQQMKVSVKYKLWTNYLDIEEEDRVTRNSVEYDVKLVDPSFLINKILVILLDTKK